MATGEGKGKPWDEVRNYHTVPNQPRPWPCPSVTATLATAEALLKIQVWGLPVDFLSPPADK